MLALTGGTLAATTFSGFAAADSDEPTLVTFDSPPGARSPSSHIAPDDGFASTEWAVGKTLEVTRVTSLDAEGDGSIEHAMTRDISDEADGRVVVFEVGGEIELDGELDPETDNMIVAGQTAPYPGITLTHGTLEVDAENNFVQHVRSRAGTEVSGFASGEGDASDSVAVADESENIVLDHVTATWGTDENMSAGDTCRSVTFSNSLIAEGLAAPGLHPDGGEHSNGTLIGHDSLDVAILGNLYANSNDRHPRLKGGTHSVVAHNVAYNFDTAIRLGDDAENHDTLASIVGNVFRPGDNTPLGSPIVDGDEEDMREIRAYLSHNVTQGPLSMTPDETFPTVNFVDEPPEGTWPEGLNLRPKSAAFGSVANTAGAQPAQRTPNDARVVRDTRQKKGGIINTEDEVGGYPDLPSTERSLDVPTENFGDWLYQFTRAVEVKGAKPPQ